MIAGAAAPRAARATVTTNGRPRKLTTNGDPLIYERLARCNSAAGHAAAAKAGSRRKASYRCAS